MTDPAKKEIHETYAFAVSIINHAKPEDVSAMINHKSDMVTIKVKLPKPVGD